MRRYTTQWQETYAKLYQKHREVHMQVLYYEKGQPHYGYDGGSEKVVKTCIDYMPPPIIYRALTADEILKVRRICLKMLMQSGEDKTILASLTAIHRFARFLLLLREPENIIALPGRQVTTERVPICSQQDMITRMARELAYLPRFSARAKILREKNGEQDVWKGEIETRQMKEVAHTRHNVLKNTDVKITGTDIEKMLRARLMRLQSDATQMNKNRRR